MKPTHEHGHTINLVISHGLLVSLREIVDPAISDHLLVVFDFAAPPPANKPVFLVRRRQIFTPSMAGEFAAAFRNSQLLDDCGLVSPLCPDSLLSTFHSTCSEILDSVAPFQQKTTKTKSDPWLNDDTRLLR